MKLKFIFQLAFCTLLFIGCSIDEQEDFLKDSSGIKTSEVELKAKVVNRPFKSKASGNWFFTESTNCNGLLQFSIKGNGKAIHLGIIDVEGVICTIPNEQFYLSGKYIAANGDELYWESVEVFFDEFGLFAGGVFDFVGGTGRFSDATGSFRSNETLIVEELDETTGQPVSGTFSNDGWGTIIY
ncbi:hypothetical protein C8P64_0222 [Christiangramia gaetbulicola]|uniref:Uncharacterized protein n=1 Tax=Christiangramia gaetbulicola TaxID=703340 RepID=A0A2T6AKA5_9FLAO|nr:hypothetical protein [Christiangramia gaetbulicola]PTX44248.1 hypothetical protein C8P64_0222 [Christiangramia gaetbulicola]